VKNLVPIHWARVILGLMFTTFGIYQLINGSAMASMVPMFEQNIKVLMVYSAGVALILGGISFITQIMVKIGGYSLALLMLLNIIFIHIPVLSIPEKMSMLQILKDIGLAMAAIYVANEGD